MFETTGVMKLLNFIVKIHHMFDMFFSRTLLIHPNISFVDQASHHNQCPLGSHDVSPPSTTLCTAWAVHIHHSHNTVDPR